MTSPAAKAKERRRAAEAEKERIRKSFGENRPFCGPIGEAPSAACTNGTFVGVSLGSAAVFKGIPFARPPIGPLRWKKPEPAPDADGVFEAFYNGKSPIQTEWETERASYYPQGEDCLYLNVWLNTACKNDKKPVMVFFHGGAFGWGGTADPLYDGRNFVLSEPDIVLIVPGYRTGIMGFIDFSEVPGGEDYPDAPNLGIYDQIEALRWVKKNAEAFGGDPENVTVFGESAGGGSASLLPCIPAAKGLFKRAIAESGSVALTFSKEECLGFTRRLIKETGAKTMDDLNALSQSELKKANEPINQYNNFPQRDGSLIPEDPYEPYMNGVTADTDLMIGTNANELNYWIGELGGIVPYRLGIPVKFENDLKKFAPGDRAAAKAFLKSLKGHEMWRLGEFYNELMFRLPAIRQAELHKKNGGRVFMYYWTEPSAIKLYGACHAVELAYVFGNTADTVYTGAPADKALSKRVMDMWAEFARTGTPCREPEWPQYDEEKRSALVLEKNAHVETDILKDQRERLFPLLKYRLNGSYAELDLHVPFVRKAALKILLLIAAITALILLIIFK